MERPLTLCAYQGADLGADMPVSIANTIDGIGVNRATGKLVLNMCEEREWQNPAMQMKDLEAKLNRYLDFLWGGQLQEHAEYVGREIEIWLFVQYQPPLVLRQQFEWIEKFLASKQITFQVFVGPTNSSPKLEWWTPKSEPRGL
jgi:hypothetical protein